MAAAAAGASEPHDNVSAAVESAATKFSPASPQAETADCEAVTAPPAERRSFAQFLLLATLIAAWYATSVSFSMQSKKVLRKHNCPFLLASACFFAGALLACIAWLTGLQETPALRDRKLVRSSFTAATWHTAGCMLTNYSLVGASVAFLHTIKATEPAFAAVLSYFILGSQPPARICAALAVLISGVALTSYKEHTFGASSFAAGIGSNVVLQLRNVLSKRTMLTGAGSDASADTKLGLSNQFNLMTMGAFLLSVPVAIMLDQECTAFCSASIMQRAYDVQLLSSVIICALSFHAYQQLSFSILERVTPLTHSVANCIKRVVVIVYALVATGTSVAPLQSLGLAVSLLGLVSYSALSGK
jgi:solute carrier family 35 protein E1